LLILVSAERSSVNLSCSSLLSGALRELVNSLITCFLLKADLVTLPADLREEEDVGIVSLSSSSSSPSVYSDFSESVSTLEAELVVTFLAFVVDFEGL